MSVARTVAKNATALLGGAVTTQILNLLYLSILARYLGVHGFGQISTATSLIAAILIFSNFGFDSLLIRELAADRRRAASYVPCVIYLRLIFVACLAPVLAVILQLSPYSATTREVIWIYALVGLIDSVSGALSTVFIAYQRMAYRAGIELFRQVLNVSVSLFGIWQEWTIVQLVWVSVFASAMRLLITYLAVNYRFTDLSWHGRYSIAIILVKSSFPFFLGLLLTVLHIRLPVLIISWFGTMEMAGLFSAALLPILTILLVPDMIGDSIFPVMSNAHRNQPTKLAGAYRALFRILLVLGLPMGVGAMLIAGDVMALVYGAEFDSSVAIFMVLSAYLLTIPTYANGLYLAATVRQSTFNRIRACFIALAAPLFVLAMPKYGPLGVAVTFVSVAFCEWIYFTGVCHRLLQLAFAWAETIRIALCTAVAGIAGLLLLKLGTAAILLVPLVATVYAFTLLLARVLGDDDWRTIKVLPLGGFLYTIARGLRAVPGRS